MQNSYKQYRFLKVVNKIVVGFKYEGRKQISQAISDGERKLKEGKGE